MAGGEHANGSKHEHCREERHQGFHWLHKIVLGIEMVNVALEAGTRHHAPAITIRLRLQPEYGTAVGLDWWKDFAWSSSLGFESVFRKRIKPHYFACFHRVEDRRVWCNW